MKSKRKWMGMAGLIGWALVLSACGTTGTGNGTSGVEIETALPLVRTGAAMATGGVLDFAVPSGTTRTKLANEMYAAAKAVYSLTGETLPTPGEFQASLVVFGGTPVDGGYARFASAMAGLYGAYYTRLITTDAKAGAELLNAIAGGIEDATQAYVSVSEAVSSVLKTEVSF